MISVSSSTFHVWVTPKVTVFSVREMASSGSSTKVEHVEPWATLRDPSETVRASQLGADEGATVGPTEGMLVGATVGPAVGPTVGTFVGPAVGPTVGTFVGASVGPVEVTFPARGVFDGV
jgi:outer membrane lipoprotein SlyB